MANSIVTLFNARTSDDILANMFALAAQLGVDVVGVQAEALFRTLFEIEAREKAFEDALRVQVAQGGFLDTVQLAGSDWVDLIAQGWFGLLRAPATMTTGFAQLVCGPFAVIGNVPARSVRFTSTTGVTFTNSEAFTVIPNTTINPIQLECVTAGTIGNVSVNTITTINPTLTDCIVSNPGNNGSWIVSSGIDTETDASVCARCLARWAATSYGGAASAYREWVNNAFAAYGAPNTINRVAVDDTNPNGPGSTDVYLADAAGPATAQELGIVGGYMLPRRSLGTGPLRFLPAPVLNMPIVATIYGNQNGVALGAAALQALQASVPLGGIVYFSTLLSTLRNIPGVYNVAMMTPAPGVDVVLPNFEVPTFVPNLTAVQ